MITNTGTRKGHIVIMEGIFTGKGIRFPINPGEMSDNKAVHFSDHKILARSHPKSHFNSGGKRTISFNLNLDAKSESLEPDNVGVTDIATVGLHGVDSWKKTTPTVFPSKTHKLRECVNFFQAFMYPRVFTGHAIFSTDAVGGPPKVQFVFGSDMTLLCIVKKADVKLLEWNEKLVLLRASISVVLEEQPPFTKTFGEHLQFGDIRVGGS